MWLRAIILNSLVFSLRTTRYWELHISIPIVEDREQHHSRTSEGKVVLSHEELSLLLGGIDLAKTRHKRWHRKASPDGHAAG